MNNQVMGYSWQYFFVKVFNALAILCAWINRGPDQWHECRQRRNRRIYSGICRQSREKCIESRSFGTFGDSLELQVLADTLSSELSTGEGITPDALCNGLRESSQHRSKQPSPHPPIHPWDSHCWPGMLALPLTRRDLMISTCERK